MRYSLPLPPELLPVYLALVGPQPSTNPPKIMNTPNPASRSIVMKPVACKEKRGWGPMSQDYTLINQSRGLYL